MVMEKALSREGSAGFLRESRIYPPFALGVPSPGAALSCACAAGTNSRKERMAGYELRRNMMAWPSSKKMQLVYRALLLSCLLQRLFGVECRDRIEAHGAQRRDIAGGERYRSQ